MKLKTVGLFAVAAILVLGAPMLGAKILTWMAERELGKAEKLASSVGAALTVEKALKNYQPGPDETNAAEGFKAVLRETLEAPRPGSNEFQPPWKEPYKTATDKLSEATTKLFRANNKPDWNNLRKRVEPFRDILPSLESAARKPDWNFKRSWEQGMAMLVPDAIRLKQICTVLYLHAMVATHDGDTVTAISSIDTLLRLAHHVQTEPNLVPINIGTSCFQLGYRAILDMERIRPLGSKELDALVDLLNRRPPSVNWKLVWNTEQASSLETMELFLTEKGLTDLGLKRGDGHVPYSRRKYLTAKVKAVRILGEAAADWEGSPTSDAEASRIATKYGIQLNEVFAQYSDVMEMLSAGGTSDLPMIHCIAATQRQETLRRLTYLALQITSQPKGQWRLPAEAKQEAWLDPFSGKPMRLKVDANGFKLYSIGTNGVDDGGVEKGANDEPLDIVVSFPSR